MSSRDSILATVKKNQPEAKPLPVIENFIPFAGDNISKFREVLTAIGGDAVDANSIEDVVKHLQTNFPMQSVSLLYRIYFTAMRCTITQPANRINWKM
jgi:L-lactate dehydrogenase complex protein LldG